MSKAPYQGSPHMKNFNTKIMPRNWNNLTRALLDENFDTQTIPKTWNNKDYHDDF